MLMKNVFYFAYINDIGGVETFFYNIANQYRTKDIRIYYREGSPAQVERIRKYVRIVKWKGEPVKCEKCFLNYNAKDFVDKVEADEIIQIIHADYQAQQLTIDHMDKVDRFVAVSQHAADAFTQKTGKPCEVYYPPVVCEYARTIRLVSATRLTPEKGLERMERLATILDDAGVNYTWEIFTNSTERFLRKSPNVVFRKPKINICGEITAADWVVQLSDTEAFCFTVVEALRMGTPVIVTDLPVFDEIGLNDENSIRLPLDFEIFDVELIRGHLSFEYEPPRTDWSELMASGGKSWIATQKKHVVVECVVPFLDLVDHLERKAGDRWSTTIRRADELMEKGLVK